MKLKINGLIQTPKWKQIKCKCDKTNIELSFPLIKCSHCKCEAQENSMPRNSFKINETQIDKNGKDTGKLIIREVKEITIKRSNDGYESILGWSF